MAGVNVTFPGNLAQVQTAADLRAIPSTFIADGDLYLVNGLQGLFEYDPGSVSIDDGTDIIRPNDKTPLQAGRWIRNVDGLASGPKGETGPADNTYHSYTEMQASDPTRASANLVGDTDVPPRPDGPYNNPTQTVNGWVAQKDDGVQSRRSTQWAVRDVSKRLNDSAPHFFDVNGLSDAEKVKIVARTTTADVTGLLTAAIALAASGNTYLQLPAGLMLVSGEGAKLVSNSGLIGMGRGNTVIRKTTPDQSYAALASSVNNILLRDLTIDGARTAPGSFINSNFGFYANGVNGCILDGIDVIGARGDGATFEYGSGLRAINSRFNNNDKDGLYTPGATDVSVIGCEATGNNLIGFAFAATRYLRAVGCYAAGNTLYDGSFSRDTLDSLVSACQFGDEFQNNTAQFALNVFGEPIGNNETLHKRLNGTGGINYPVTSDMSARKMTFDACRFYGAVSVELAQQVRFVAPLFAKSPSHAMAMYGCSDTHITNPTFVDYALSGIVLLNSPKNGVVPNARNTVDRGEWIQAGAPDSYGRIADAAGLGGLRESESRFNGTECMFGSLDTTIPIIPADTTVKVADIFTPLIKQGDPVERLSFSVATPGILLSAEVTGTNTVAFYARNIDKMAETPAAIPGTARVWFARK